MYSSTLAEDAVYEPQEYKLWRAVLATTVEDWLSDRLRSRRDAEVFLFQDETDFPTVCHAAGVDPSIFRSRLRRFKKQGNGSVELSGPPN